MNDKWRSISFNFFKTVQKTLRARKRLCKKTAMSVERAAQQTVRLIAAEVIEQLAGNTPLQNPVKKNDGERMARAEQKASCEKTRINAK
jgi:hypothetical protein